MSRPTPDRRAFTLVELMTAMAVLGILVLILAQSVGMVADAWKAGKARIDNYSQARMAMSLLDRDIQSSILRGDLAAFVDENGDRACGFYTEMRGDSGDRKVSLVEYFFDPDEANPALKRKDYGLNYETGESSRTLTLGVTDKLTDLADTNDALNEVEIAEGVLAFNWQFIANDGTLTPDFSYDYDDPDATTNTRAMVISMVILDGGTDRLAENLEVIDDLVSAFEGTPGDGETHAEFYQGKLDAMTGNADIPVLLQQSIEVFERTVQLPLVR